MKKAETLVLTLLLLSSILVGTAGTASGCTKEDFDKAIFGETGKQVIYIGPDGAIDPPTAPIARQGNMYILTDNIYAPIVIDKDDIILNGAGYTLEGSYNGTRTDLPMDELEEQSNGSGVPWTVGIDFAKGTRNGITIKNLNITNFSIGIWLWASSNVVIGNAITENILGILLSAPDNFITGNYIANNEDGIFFGANEPGNIPTNVTLSRNSFRENFRQLSGCICEEYNETEDLHTWDNGKEGNYWSDYAGIDANGDGIGDIPYVIDVLNQDRFPLVRSVAVLPSVAPPFPLDLAIIVVVLISIAVVALIGRKRKHSQKAI